METNSFVRELLRVVPELQSIYDEHIRDNGSLLSHVFFGNVTRFAIAEADKGKNSSALIRLLEQLEMGLQRGNPEVSELIAVSFVENLCGEKAIRSLKPLMGENLKKELAVICGE